VVLLDHIVDLFLIFKEASTLFSKMVALAYIPLAVYKHSFSLATLPTFVVVSVLHDSYSNRSEVEF
jgi:hypothetical protein